MKTQGSKKIGALCPANITMLKKGDKCEVTYFKTHVGHNDELGHLFLTAPQREELAAKIASKIPLSTILDQVRDSVTDCELQRIHLLKKKDLHNIEKSFNLNSSSVRHVNDAVSVDSWAREMEACRVVLYYKPQDTLCEKHSSLKAEDFALIIMTPGQKELLAKFGGDCICIDGTHGVNGYGFELTTLLVLDDLREGYPCAFLISNRTDEGIMAIFFSYISKEVGKLTPTVFMSDMAEAYYNGWLSIMGAAQYRLFCSWHVDRAWRRNLDKIVSKEKKSLVYQILRTILQERDVNAFHQMLSNFLSICQSDAEISDFGNYFERHYANRSESWAYCFRLHSGLNTNMHIERMHHTIKYLYLNAKFVKRLDKAIHAIMKFVRDQMFERLISIHKGKLSSKLSDLRKKHNNSLSLDEEKVLQTEMGWEVPSASRNEIYIIEELKSLCSCKLKCMECNACLHQYSCSCLDSSIKWNMCKHIHLVCRYRQNRNNPAVVVHPMIETADSSSEVVNIVKSLSQKEPGSSGQSSLEEEKAKVLADFTEQLSTVKTSEQLAAIKQMIAPIRPTLKALENEEHAILPFSSSIPKNTPHNKNIVPQRRLFSTNKKSAVAKKLPTPSSSATDILAYRLLSDK